MDKIKNVAQRLGIITVEDMERYTALELMMMIANKMNECQEIINEQNVKLQDLFDKGLLSEVEQIFDEWLEDGTFDTLINQSALKDVNDRIDDLKERVTSESVSVLEYGAIGDGVTDDTQAFKNAIASGKNIFIPINGYTYKITDTLQPQQYQMIYGDRSVGKLIGDDFGIKVVGNISLFDLSNKNITLKNLRLIGDNLIGIGVNNPNESRLYDVECTNFDIGIRQCVFSTDVISCRCHHNNIGMRFATDTRIISTHLHNNKLYGLYLPKGSGDNHIIASKFDWNGENMFLSSCKKTMIVGCVIDRATKYGINLNNCETITISSNLLRRNYIEDGVSADYVQLRVFGSSNISISDNQVITSPGSDELDDDSQYPSSTIKLTDCVNVSTNGNTLIGRDRNSIYIENCDNISLNDKNPHTMNITNEYVNGRACLVGHNKYIEFNAKCEKSMESGAEYIIFNHELLKTNSTTGAISGYVNYNKDGLLRYIIDTNGTIKFVPQNGNIEIGAIINFVVSYY